MDFDTRVRAAIYDHVVETTLPPSIQEVASTLDSTPEDVGHAYRRLYDKRVLVLEPDGATIRMAPPFSGVPTQHRVSVDGREYMANCSWDALGVAAALHADADVHSRCEQSLEPLDLRVRGGTVEPEPCAVHFAVPAAHWWDDIVYT